MAPYCCTAPGEPGRCSQAAFALPATLLDKRGKKQYAAVTLLMMGDGYLPGALMLARSLREASPRLAAEIDLVCMVTPDVSAQARTDLATEFDVVDPVDYIAIDPRRVPHPKSEVRPVYARTFTKLRCLAYAQYAKVLLLDADMVAVRPEVFALFAMDPPAAVFFGCLRPFMAPQFADHVAAYCPQVSHGETIPAALFADKACRNVPRGSGRDGDKRVFIGVETSIALLAPSATDLAAMRQTLEADAKSQGPPKYAGDTTLLSEAFEGRWRAMDMRFLGRWTSPALRPEVFTIDMYGSEGKPWDVARMDAKQAAAMRAYPDVAFWLASFERAYRDTFAKRCRHPALRALANAGERLQKITPTMSMAKGGDARSAWHFFDADRSFVDALPVSEYRYRLDNALNVRARDNNFVAKLVRYLTHDAEREVARLEYLHYQPASPHRDKQHVHHIARTLFDEIERNDFEGHNPRGRAMDYLRFDVLAMMAHIRDHFPKRPTPRPPKFLAGGRPELKLDIENIKNKFGRYYTSKSDRSG